MTREEAEELAKVCFRAALHDVEGITLTIIAAAETERAACEQIAEKCVTERAAEHADILTRAHRDDPTAWFVEGKRSEAARIRNAIQKRRV